MVADLERRVPGAFLGTDCAKKAAFRRLRLDQGRKFVTALNLVASKKV